MKTSSASTMLPCRVDAELELGVGDDDSAGERVVGGLDVGLQGAVAQLVGADGADQFDDVGEADVLVVCAEFGLGGRREQRLVELAGLPEAGRQRDAADLTGALVVQQAGAGEVAAGHTLHRHHVECANHQRAAQHLVGDARIVGRPGQVVGRVDEVEEEHAHRGQDPALVRDLAVQDVVECRDPVGRHEEQMFVVDAVQLADLAAGQVLIVGQSGTHRVSLADGRAHGRLAARAADVLGSGL